MATLQHHLPFGFFNPSQMPLKCHSVGRSPFSFIDSSYLEPRKDRQQQQQHTAPELPPRNDRASSFASPASSESRLKQDEAVLHHLQDVIGVCNGYMEELTGVCNAGVQTAHCLASSIKEAALLSEANCSCPAGSLIPFEAADRFSDAWDQLAFVTSGAIASLRESPFSVLQDTISELEHRQSTSHGPVVTVDESNRILMTSLLAMMHLQYQFSLCVCDALVDLVQVNPEDLCPNQLSEVPAEDSGVKEQPSIKSLSLCTESLADLCKNFVNLREKIHATATSQESSHFANPRFTPVDVARDYRKKSVSLFPKVDARPKSSASEWSRSPSLDTSLSMLKSQTESNGSAAHAFSFQANSDFGLNHDQIWRTEMTSPESLWPNCNKMPDLKESTQDLQEQGALASNEELQDVISLLSCQPSVSCSPNSDASNSSFNVAHGLRHSTSHSNPLQTKTVGSHIHYGPDRAENGIAQSSESSSLKHACPWYNKSHHGMNETIWGQSPSIKETPPGKSMNAYELLATEKSCGLTPVATTKPSNEGFPQMAAGYNRRACISSNGNRYYQDASIPACWPVSCDIPARNSSPQGSSICNSHEGYAKSLVGKNGNFFIGLDLVGTDLVASVRQRRHSSGSSFPEIGSSYCPSARTKSIDNIMMEDEDSEMTKWPMTHACSRPPASALHMETIEMGKEDVATMNSAAAASIWSSDIPQGLPPSGVESRNKQKHERKYSLFGQPT